MMTIRAGSKATTNYDNERQIIPDNVKVLCYCQNPKISRRDSTLSISGDIERVDGFCKHS